MRTLSMQVFGAVLPDDLVPGVGSGHLHPESHRGKGIGETALRLLKDEVFATTLAVAVCVFASIENEAAVRAYEKAGFRWRRVWHDPISGPEWFMIAERPSR